MFKDEAETIAAVFATLIRMASSHKYNRPWFAWALIVLGIGGLLWLRFRDHRPKDATAEEVPARPYSPERLQHFHEDSISVKAEPQPVSAKRAVVRKRTQDSRPPAGHFYERISTDDGSPQLNVIDRIEPADRLDSLPGGTTVTVGDPLIIVR